MFYLSTYEEADKILKFLLFSSAALATAVVVTVAASSHLWAALFMPVLDLGTTAILSVGTSITTFLDHF